MVEIHNIGLDVNMFVRPAQLRMARAGLGLTVQQLAEQVGVHANTILRYESGSQILSGTLDKIEAVLAQAGIIFLEAEGELGPGVRLREQITSGVGGHGDATKHKAKKRKQKIAGSA
jgi:transcriptional regulator with XRE-family HTH domain